jgi:hypothetical protein
MAKGSGRRKRKETCDDCYFRCNGLCALDLAEPCATFRPNLPQGLVPPSQLRLLARESGDGSPEPAPLAHGA